MIDVPNDKHNFIKKMASLGIVCGIGVDFPLHKMYGSKENLPNTDLAVKNSVALPIRPNLSNSELRKISTAVKKSLYA